MEGNLPTWMYLAMWGPALLQLVVVLAFILKMAPTWKDIRLTELGIKKEENKVRGEEAAALLALSKSLETMSETTGKIAIEQRKATETVEILQRVNADSADHLSQTVAVLADRVDRLEERTRHDKQEATGTRAN